jgi:Holliday junction DNA helicase RuvA
MRSHRRSSRWWADSVIARLRGRPVASTPEGLLIDVGGVGYLVAATPSAVRKADGAEEVTVETYLHVREDAMQLYGFAERAERELFVQLLSVNGVGPKVALAIVSGSPAEELRRAIVREDAVRFQAIPGIGKKTAERIVLELKEKLAVTAIAPVGGADADDHVVARDALVELGYSIADAERALAGTESDASPEERVRQALRRAA